MDKATIPSVFAMTDLVVSLAMVDPPMGIARLAFCPENLFDIDLKNLEACHILESAGLTVSKINKWTGIFHQSLLNSCVLTGVIP